MKKQALLLLIILCSVSCKKTELPQRDTDIPSTFIMESEKDTLDVVWAVRLGETSGEQQNMHPILYKGNILTSYQDLGETHNERLLMFDGETGELRWKWDNYLSTKKGDNMERDGIHTFDNMLLACSDYSNYGIDLTSGQTIWQNEDNEGGPLTSFNNGLLFHPRFNLSLTKSSMHMAEAKKGNWREIYIVHEGEYNQSLEPPTAFFSDTGDTLIIMANRKYRTNPYKQKTDLLCYNITQNTMVWTRKDMTPSGNCSIEPPIIDGNYAYFMGQRAVFCLDKTTGKTIWTYDGVAGNYGFVTSNYLIHDHKFIFKRDDGALIAVDKQTGSLLWENTKIEEVGACCAEMRIYGDRIYFATRSLYIVDVHTGKGLYKFKSPAGSIYSRPDILGAVAVDEEQDLMYVTDGFYLHCARVPD